MPTSGIFSLSFFCYVFALGGKEREDSKKEGGETPEKVWVYVGVWEEKMEEDRKETGVLVRKL